MRTEIIELIKEVLQRGVEIIEWIKVVIEWIIKGGSGGIGGMGGLLLVGHGCVIEDVAKEEVRAGVWILLQEEPSINMWPYVLWLMSTTFIMCMMVLEKHRKDKKEWAEWEKEREEREKKKLLEEEMKIKRAKAAKQRALKALRSKNSRNLW